MPSICSSCGRLAPLSLNGREHYCADCMDEAEAINYEDTKPISRAAVQRAGLAAEGSTPSFIDVDATTIDTSAPDPVLESLRQALAASVELTAKIRAAILTRTEQTRRSPL